MDPVLISSFLVSLLVEVIVVSLKNCSLLGGIEPSLSENEPTAMPNGPCPIHSMLTVFQVLTNEAKILGQVVVHTP